MYTYLKSSTLKSWSLVIFSSVLLSLSMPGYSLSPLAFIALVPFFYAIGLERKNVYLKVLVFALIFYITSLRWLIITVSHYGAAPIYVSLIILFLFALYLSIYWLLFIYLYLRIDNKIILSTIFIILEIMKGTFLTGFPWLNLAQSQFNNIYILKITSIFGEYGLSFIIFITNLYFADYFLKNQLKPLFKGITIPLLTMFIGYILIEFNNPVEKSLRVTIVQPVYEQKLKWDEKSSEAIVNYNKKLIDKALTENTDLIILPEAAFPVFLEFHEELFNYLIDLSYKKPILFGNIRMDFINKKYFNSNFFINKGNISLYDKIHLVPFGEYFPLQKLFKPIKYYFFGDSDAFSSGKIASTFKFKNFTFAAIICYEGAYTGLVQRFMKTNPDFFVINTNDSWFGNSIGRFQHLSIAVLRATETSKFVLRAAQSGMSACIDPNGRIVNYLGVNEEGSFNCTITQSKFNALFNEFQYSWLVILILWVAYNYIKDIMKKKNIAKKGN